MRSSVLTAEVVCSVPSTRWPVSAASMAMVIVSGSRNSPTRITSGSSRKAACKPSAKEGTWFPTLRWITSDCLLSCIYSMGSSRVIIFKRRLWLIQSIIAARVVVLPVPVAPVTSIIPWVALSISWTAGGKPSSCNDGIFGSITRNTAPGPLILR